LRPKRASASIPLSGRSFGEAQQPDTVSIQAPGIYRPDHRRETLYFQDAWSAADRITINAGVRIGFYQGAITGQPTQFSASSIAPRIGVAWDVLPQHTMSVRGHYGRYHEAMVTSFYDFLDPLSHPTYISAQVIGPNQFSEIYRDASSNLALDPNTRYPYADEWVAGIDRARPYRFFADCAVHRPTVRLHRGLRRNDGGLDACSSPGSGA
jgi:hypothetical protein